MNPIQEYKSGIESSLAMGRNVVNPNIATIDYAPTFPFVITAVEIAGKIKVDTAGGQTGVFILCNDYSGSPTILTKIYSLTNGTPLNVGTIQVNY